MWQRLTWLLNKYWEDAEGHLYGLLQTLITNLTWFGGFPRDAGDQVSEYVQGLLDDCFHCRRTRNKQNSQSGQRLQWLDQAGRKIYWLLSRSVCLGGMFTVPLKRRYSRVRAATRLPWLVERVCHCCSFSGKLGHGSSSMLDKALHTNMWACRRRHKENVSSVIKWGWLH